MALEPLVDDKGELVFSTKDSLFEVKFIPQAWYDRLPQSILWKRFLELTAKNLGYDEFRVDKFGSNLLSGDGNHVIEGYGGVNSVESVTYRVTYCHPTVNLNEVRQAMDKAKENLKENKPSITQIIGWYIS